MITINQYIKLIEDYLKSHKQINTVLTNSESDFSAYDKIVYPVAHIDYVTQRISDTNISHQFEIIIGDLFDPNIPGSEFEIYSDCNLIADDVITYFENQFSDDYEIDPNTSIQKFSDANVDRVAGAVFVITFNQFRQSNDCITPTVIHLGDLPDNIIYYGAVNGMPDSLSGLPCVRTTEATLVTGLNNKFAVAVKQGYQLLSVIDLSASNLDLTGAYEPSGTLTDDNKNTYDLYYFEQALNYSSSHNHKIKIEKE